MLIWDDSNIFNAVYIELKACRPNSIVDCVFQMSVWLYSHLPAFAIIEKLNYSNHL